MEQKIQEKPKKIRIDEKDKEIINILSENSRETLTRIARKVGLSIDSTKTRIDKLKEAGVILRFTIQVDTTYLDLPLGYHVHVKFKNIKKERIDEFINYLKNKKKVVDLFSVLGDYDVLLVVLAENTQDMNNFKTMVRDKFNDIIADWKEVLIIELHKFEEYKF
jgi:Lrp/AsnC family transcriptional regulator